ncbi:MULTISPECIES: cytochrome c biogenesis CcdA family protein [unclassified Luteococcus]|uniref:cytochrome c biogenesis CcdA family protein n=1 Tax=unclassified Luteococcus TaxID=2639923 RepID=UPI00313A80A0
MADLTVPVALLAGIVSFTSPCFLPIVPVYVGYLAGVDEAERTRATALRQSLAFVLGFSVVFTGIYAAIGAFGWAVAANRETIRWVGGLVLVVMGLHVARLVEIPFLSRSFGGPRSGRGAQAPSVRRSLLLGLAFGAGWSPCIGPMLGAIISLALQQGGLAQGSLLLVAYSLGLGLPFVAVALGAGWVSEKLAWFTRHETAVQLVSGALLVLTGFLVITNQFSRLSAFGV